MKKILKWIKRIVLSIIALILLIVLPILGAKGIEKIRISRLTDQERMIEDIDRFSYLMQNEFPAFDQFIDRDQFTNQLDQLKKQIESDSNFTRESLQVSFIRLVASFKDPHTIAFNFRELMGTTFPYKIEWFDSAFHLTSGQVSDPSWLGAKVVRFGTHDPQTFYDKMSNYSNAPNPAGTTYFMSMFIAVPSILYHEGLIETKEEITIQLQKENGEVSDLKFKAIPQPQLATLTDYQTLATKFADKEKPLYKQNREQNYWFKHLPDDNTLYLRYSSCVAQGDIEAFWTSLFSVADEKQPARFVIDLRGNPGGDSQNHVTLLHELVKRPWLNKFGKLYTITDRGTGSAAVSLTSELERRTNTILVGEQPVDRSNTTSDPTFFTLPYSGVKILLPSLYSLHSHIYDQRIGIDPDIKITTSFAYDGYLADPALDSIRNMNPWSQSYISAEIPDWAAGTYIFSPLRNLTLSKQDTSWTFQIDGLLETPIYQNDSGLYTRIYQVQIASITEGEKNLNIQLHGSNLTLSKVPNGQKSLISLVEDGEFEKAKEIALKLKADPKKYYLDRPLFQNWIYNINKTKGLEHALALNDINKALFPNDPVGSIIDYELYQYHGGDFVGQTKAIFSVLGKMIKRYYNVITTEKIMNDDYNSFIGR